MARKAISPVIATVILIAIAVTLGGVLSSWMNSFVRETTDTETCAIRTLYTVTDATYDADSGEVRMKVRNTGSSPLYNFTMEADNGTVIVSLLAGYPAADFSLVAGQSQYVSANFSGQNITEIEKVTLLSGSCQSYSSSPVKVAHI